MRPIHVQNFTITPDPQAGKKATITFTTPKVDIDGRPLSGLFRFTVEREGKGVVKVTEYPARDKQYTFEDVVEESGFATYTIYCTNKNGDGRKLTKTAYIGLDVPKAPANGRLTDQQSSIKIDWDAVGKTGKNGGVVLPDNVLYQVYNVVYDNKGNPSVEVLDETNNTTYEVSRNTEEGSQEFIFYALSAKNDAGISTIAATKGLVVGTPYTLPITESISGGNLNLLWWLERTGSTSFGITSTITYDNDGGAFVFNTKVAGDEAYLNTGKISLKDTKHPQLSFYHYSLPGKPIKLQVVVRKPDNTLVKVGEFNYATFTGEKGWQKNGMRSRPEPVRERALHRDRLPRCQRRSKSANLHRQHHFARSQRTRFESFHLCTGNDDEGRNCTHHDFCRELWRRSNQRLQGTPHGRK